jgi:perosamine synthetase
VSTTSGTTALMMAIESLNLPKGSTILFPAYTFLAGANAARFMGYKVRLIDVNNKNYCMRFPDKKDLKDVSCIMFVNHNGYDASGPSFYNFCKANKIKLIEDSSQCLGNRFCGKYGDVSVLSFSVPKLVTTGQGGAVLTDDEKLYKKLKEIRDHGDNWRKTRIHEKLGVNFKFNDILASYGLAQLKDFTNIKYKKELISCWYKQFLDSYGENLNKGLLWEVPWMFIYETKKADRIIEELQKSGIQAVKYYRPISDNPPYKTKRKFPVAERLGRELLYLPSSLHLKKREIKKICAIILNVEFSEVFKSENLEVTIYGKI